MMMNGNRESAKIFEFPAGRRGGPARQRAEAEVASAGRRGEVVDGPKSWMVQQPAVEIVWGSWYHEAAVKEASAVAGR